MTVRLTSNSRDTFLPSRRQIELRHCPVPAHRHFICSAAFDQAGGDKHRHFAVDRFVVAAQFARQPPHRTRTTAAQVPHQFQPPRRHRGHERRERQKRHMIARLLAAALRRAPRCGEARSHLVKRTDMEVDRRFPQKVIPSHDGDRITVTVRSTANFGDTSGSPELSWGFDKFAPDPLKPPPATVPP